MKINRSVVHYALKISLNFMEKMAVNKLYTRHSDHHDFLSEYGLQIGQNSLLMHLHCLCLMC